MKMSSNQKPIGIKIKLNIVFHQVQAYITFCLYCSL